MKAIKNGKIILEKELIEGKVLLFDKKIEGIVSEDEIPANTEIIDAAGNYVAPGLIDLHIHGFRGEDVSDGKAAGIKKMSEGLIENGVTAYLPTTLTIPRKELEKVAAVIRELKEESLNWNGSLILGMHAEGPFVNPFRKGAQNEEYIQRPDASLIIDNKDIIKIVTLAPEMDDDYLEIQKIVENANVVVSMGHTDASYEQASEAVKAGVRHATHLFNAMTPLAHRAPGVVGAALYNENVSVEMICDKFHVHPALYKIVYKIKNNKTVIITDCLRCGGLGDGEYSLGGQKFILKGIECRLDNGTIAGSILTLNKGVYNFYKNAECSLCEAVACASINPARVIGEDNRKGSIAKGKDADLIIADESFNIIKTIIGGIEKYGRKD